MKKFLAILLVFLLVLSTFVACNSGNGGETEKPTEKQTEKDTEKSLDLIAEVGKMLHTMIIKIQNQAKVQK